MPPFPSNQVVSCVDPYLLMGEGSIHAAVGCKTCSVNPAFAVSVVLPVQSARYLLKNLLGARSGRTPQGSAAYLGNAKKEMKSKCEADSAKQWRDPAIQLAAFRCVVSAHQNAIGTQLVALSWTT